MTNLAQVWGKSPYKVPKYIKSSWPMPDQLMGIEVEIDAYNSSECKMPTPNTAFWRSARDGSLQSGMEFVLRDPMSGDMLASAINDFFQTGTIVRNTAGSTHIHMNMYDEVTNTQTLQNIVMLVYMLESGVYAVADPSREWCGYAHRLSSAPSNVLQIMMSSSLHTNQTKLRALIGTGDNNRYYGLNLMALGRYGSLEFRYFPTALSEEELASWVRMVQSFKMCALSFAKLEDIEAVVANDETYSAFLKKWFAEWYDTFISTVSRVAAEKNFNKAMAAAETANVNTKAGIDKKSVFTGSRFARLLKIKEIKVEEQPMPKVHIYNNANAPTRCENGELLIGPDSAYAWIDGGWESLDTSYTLDRLTELGIYVRRDPEFYEHVKALIDEHGRESYKALMYRKLDQICSAAARSRVTQMYRAEREEAEESTDYDAPAVWTVGAAGGVAIDDDVLPTPAELEGSLASFESTPQQYVSRASDVVTRRIYNQWMDDAAEAARNTVRQANTEGDE